ncbi:MAG TPA: hypothetical protein PKE03_04750 [Bacteroidales bacterium]|nr:hypothetical protein [Bacteroidales bacterium]
MVLQLLIIAGVFFGLSAWFFYKKRKVLSGLFALIAFFALLLFFIVRALYPHKVPF